MGKEPLILLDYSGTLSISSVRFGCAEVLSQELKRSGLADCGVAAPEVFWNRIVGTTWREASTTGITYAKAMAKAVRSIAPDTTDDAAIHNAVSRFVESYFSHSRIDPLWAPLLKRLASDFRGKTVIATDHYAEATGYIAGYFGELGIDAAACGRASTRSPSKGSFIITNSADVGAHKSERKFWEIVAFRCMPEGAADVLLVDDFGLNEVEEDAYGILDAVTARKEGTVRLIEEVFSAPVSVVFFGMEGSGSSGRGKSRERYERFGVWVSEAETAVNRFIER